MQVYVCCELHNFPFVTYTKVCFHPRLFGLFVFRTKFGTDFDEKIHKRVEHGPGKNLFNFGVDTPGPWADS